MRMKMYQQLARVRHRFQTTVRSESLVRTVCSDVHASLVTLKARKGWWVKITTD